LPDSNPRTVLKSRKRDLDQSWSGSFHGQKKPSGQIFFFFQKVDTAFVFTFYSIRHFLTSCMVCICSRPSITQHYFKICRLMFVLCRYFVSTGKKKARKMCSQN